jgi:hypothetical protein
MNTDLNIGGKCPTGYRLCGGDPQVSVENTWCIQDKFNDTDCPITSFKALKTAQEIQEA